MPCAASRGAEAGDRTHPAAGEEEEVEDQHMAGAAMMVMVGEEWVRNGSPYRSALLVSPSCYREGVDQ